MESFEILEGNKVELLCGDSEGNRVFCGGVAGGMRRGAPWAPGTRPQPRSAAP